MSDSTRLLRTSLRANAGFSATSGLLFLLGNGPVAAFLGGPSPVQVGTVGAQLLAFAAALLWLASRPLPPRALVLAVIAADLAWVAGTAVAVPAGLFSPGGSIAAVAVALVVLGFAVVQGMGARRIWPKGHGAGAPSAGGAAPSH